MDLEEIKAMSVFELARRIGVPQPDTLTSPGAVFLADTRDWYAEKRSQITEDPRMIRLAGRGQSEGGPVLDETYTLWQIFADLDLRSWDEVDQEALGDIRWENLTSMVERVVGQVANALVRELWTEDDETTGNEDEEN